MKRIQLRLKAEKHMNNCKLDSSSYKAWFNVYCLCSNSTSPTIRKQLTAMGNNLLIPKNRRKIYLDCCSVLDESEY